jgi:hypothetical protein
VLRIFIALKNPSPWPGFYPATFWSSGQHLNTTPPRRRVHFLKLFKKIITVYIENRTEPINKNADLRIVKAAGTYIYHSALNG